MKKADLAAVNKILEQRHRQDQLCIQLAMDEITRLEDEVRQLKQILLGCRQVKMEVGDE